MTPGDESTEKLILYDHCIIYVLYGSGSMHIGAEPFTISKGSLLILKPRIPYSFTKISEELSLITVNFDYTSENEEINGFYIKPDTADNFIPKKSRKIYALKRNPNLTAPFF